MATALSVLVRTAAFAAVYLVFAHLVHLEGDDGLGTGLLAFLTFMVVATAWGILDGWRWGAGRLCLVWVLVGILTGVAMAVLIQVPGDVDTEVLVSDLVTSTPFVTALIAGPAIVMGALVSALRKN